MARLKAKGTLFQMSAADLVTFTTIAQIMNVSGPGVKRGAIEASDHDTANAKDFLPEALYDGGEVSLDLHFDPNLGTHDATSGYINVLQSGAVRNFKCIFPSNPARTAAYSGFCTEFEPGAPFEGKLTAKVSVKVSGAITWS